MHNNVEHNLSGAPIASISYVEPNILQQSLTTNKNSDTDSLKQCSVSYDSVQLTQSATSSILKSPESIKLKTRLRPSQHSDTTIKLHNRTNNTIQHVELVNPQIKDALKKYYVNNQHPGNHKFYKCTKYHISKHAFFWIPKWCSPIDTKTINKYADMLSEKFSSCVNAGEGNIKTAVINVLALAVHSYRLTYAEIVNSLIILDKYIRRVQSSRHVADINKPVVNLEHFITVSITAIVLSNKFFRDIPYRNRAFVNKYHIRPKMLLSAELKLLTTIDFKIWHSFHVLLASEYAIV